MENSDDNAWTGSNIFAHLNDFEESAAENILEANSQTRNEIIDKNESTISAPEAAVVEPNDSHCKSTTETGKAKIGIKLPKLEGSNKNYVLQCQDDMTQDFIDYLKEMSSQFAAASETGEIF